MNRLVSGALFFWVWVLWAASPLGAGDPNTIRVACVGDSITYGYEIPDREHRSYPAQLARLLGSGYEVLNFGVSAATLLRHGDYSYWEREAYGQALNSCPQIVIIMLGTNDSKPHNWQRKAEFEGDYRALIASFKALPSHPRIYLCTPAPVILDGKWGITEDVVHGQIAPKVSALAQEEGLPLIDVHSALASHPECLVDHIHPDASGAAIIAKAVEQVLMNAASKAGSSRP